MTQNERVQPGADNIAAESPGTATSRRDMILLWTGILSGPFLWFTHQQICFVLVPWVCDHGGVVWLHVATLICLAGTLGAGWLGFAFWQRERGREHPTAGQQRVRFMGTLGVLSSLFFAVMIIAQGLPNFLLDPCQR